MKLNDALNRLERTGDAMSKTNLKLIESARMVAQAIVDRVGNDNIAALIRTNVGTDMVDLPRGYTFYHVDGSSYLMLDEAINGTDRQVDFSLKIDTAKSFAEDLASGWLDELIDWLAREVKNAERVMERLEAIKILA